MDFSKLAVEHISQVVAHCRNGLLLDRFSKFAKGEVFILNFLLQCGTTALPSEISAGLGSSTARIAAALGTLEKKGLITREMDKNDRRKIIVSITENGKKAAERERERIVKLGTRIFEEMGEKDAKEFNRLMKRYLELAERLEMEQ